MSSKDLAFTESESKLLTLALQCMKTLPEVDFNKLADLAGYSNVRSAGNAWLRIKKKISAQSAAPTSGSSAGHSNTNNDEERNDNDTSASKKTSTRGKKNDNAKKAENTTKATTGKRKRQAVKPIITAEDTASNPNAQLPKVTSTSNSSSASEGEVMTKSGRVSKRSRKAKEMVEDQQAEPKRAASTSGTRKRKATATASDDVEDTSNTGNEGPATKKKKVAAKKPADKGNGGAVGRHSSGWTPVNANVGITWTSDSDTGPKNRVATGASGESHEDSAPEGRVKVEEASAAQTSKFETPVNIKKERQLEEGCVV